MLAVLFKYKSWANEELLSELERLDPAAQESERHTAIRIFNHTYVVDRIFAAHLSGGAHAYSATNTPETPTLEALRDAVAESDRWYEEYAQRMTPELLSESISFKFTDGDGGRMSREEMLTHVVTHGAYHRGAIGRILAQLSIAPPRDTLSGFLHKAEPGRRERT